ncbi:sulfite exporter TauE/SafE family protein [Tuwongella immobilis]|uniref:Probable membrane transporter protein n=1 Tax=Tuwongella immobilis TaxID=692036 RepID=A0A6C2YP24_9BACT|nr:sulfite exporter TauE/SafE family protein [Tuwongella immobilis]VIP02805.1 membrane protein : Uncharacterized protein OS=Solibacter usitatus (strain Ellin6076) GN=Acid_5931 PE=4 SV=1: TauE [Tuwongella immobilis]VTS02503.1 membrane protein : Uncharacterized protein OS=Solibacter usitatus (strain Ellin6076) GN=Acid_5931 PE=4 SV=1: TauE [Tuwongella immobilis]
MDFLQTHLPLAIAAILGGMMNAVAGGGTLLTFPALVGVLTTQTGSLDLASKLANGTSTVSLLPGSLASAWGYRKEVQEGRQLLLWLIVPSIIGGAIGTLLVTELPAAIFGAAVPWLVLVAAILFALQKPLKRWILSGKPTPAATPTPDSPTIPTESAGIAGASLQLKLGVVMAQLLISIYGGYFGAGIGILMLTALSFMPLRDIHQMNALKTIFASIINGTSVVLFIRSGDIEWAYVPTMATGAILGGYFGARIARKLPDSLVRGTVIFIGFGLSAFFFSKRMGWI